MKKYIMNLLILYISFECIHNTCRIWTYSKLISSMTRSCSGLYRIDWFDWMLRVTLYSFPFCWPEKILPWIDENLWSTYKILYIKFMFSYWVLKNPCFQIDFLSEFKIYGVDLLLENFSSLFFLEVFERNSLWNDWNSVSIIEVFLIELVFTCFWFELAFHCFWIELNFLLLMS
jgi:hypothetical protein